MFLQYDKYEELINKIVWIIPSSKIRNNTRKMLYDILASIYKIEYIMDVLNTKSENIEEVVIINVEGGLASQFYFYGLGEYIKKEFNKKVKYNIDWFRVNHKDVDNNYERPFEITKFLPDAEFNIASREEVFKYKLCFSYTNEEHNGYDFDFISQKRNVYLAGYPNVSIDISNLISNIDLDKYHFNKLEGDNLILYNELVSEESVSVHIRLGDFHVFNDFDTYFDRDYNKYANYFIKSIERLSKELNNPKFFFFSEDINWIKKNIIPHLDKNIRFKINEIVNSPYIDLYLMSKAKHFIISLGGYSNLTQEFGRYKDKIVVRP